MPTNLLQLIFCLFGMLTALYSLATAAGADVYRQYSGKAGSGKVVHLNLVFMGHSVDGLFEFIGDQPVQPDVQSMAGTLAGNTLAVNATGSETGNVSLKIRATFDRSPLTSGEADLKGRLISTAGGDWPLDLKQVPFGPTNGSVVTQEVKRHGTRRHQFEYDAKFPQITGSKYAALNAAIRAFVASSSKGDLKYFMSDDNIPLPGIAPSNEFDIVYTIMEFTPHFVSIDFQMYVDSGGAHPNTDDLTFNYDLDNNRSVSLGDLFASGPSYLHEVAVNTIAVLAKNNDLEYDEIVRGASTSAPNYSVWNLTRWGLTFTFNSYQVGAYAVGPQQVLFPLKSLKLSPRTAKLLSGR